MVFSVISLAPDLTGAARERAIAAAPAYTDSPAPYATLLCEMGFQVLRHDDVTAAFARLTRRDLEAYEARAPRIVQLIGEDGYAQRLALRRDRMRAIQDGLLHREIFLARPAIDPEQRNHA